jgi:hypothetical protein
MIELLRKLFLLMILFVVAMGTYLSGRNSTDWQEPLWVQIYPINGDDRQTTADYIANLEEQDFISIEEFMQEEADWYEVNIDQPVRIILGNELHEHPPALADNPGPLNIALWSLKMRWWARNITSDQPGPRPDIRLFVIYFDPAEQQTVAHSLGLQKGLIGVVNVFASRTQAKTNHFVIAHEMLHTLGATDKYNFADNMPAYPEGYADPELTPLYPQTQAELMGGRIPITKSSAAMPANFSQVVIGPWTAAEIRWTE